MVLRGQGMKPGKAYRGPSRAEINLRNLDYNFRLAKRLAGKKVKMLVAVKADGYGHGMVEVSKRLEKLGVDYLGVARIDEGVILRKAGIKKNILVLSAVFPEDARWIFDYNLIPAVCTEELARALNETARRGNSFIPVHIKVDTGMHRIGLDYKNALKLIKKIFFGFKNLTIEGVFTHFPCADNDPVFTKKQISLFNGLVKKIEAAGISIPLKHAANSLGLMYYPNGHFNMVRPGLMIYGLSPKGRLRYGLKPVLTLKTRISFLKAVSKGKGISYGHSYITGRKTNIATLPIGYGDGYPRILSNRAFCLINGKRAKIIGRICMDQMMADVTGIKKVRIGAEAVLIGSQKGKTISAEYLAGLAETIPYEIVCGLGSRIRRAYIQ